MYYYLGDVMRYMDISFNNILLDEISYKKYENILSYDISYETIVCAKPLRIRFDEIDGFIKIYDEIIYLVSRDYERYNAIYDGIQYFINEKGGIINSIKHNFAGIRIDWYNSLPTEKMLTCHNVIILKKSIVNKNKNDYYENIFLA